ncbi:hypothetical protein [Bradyrhizobium sp. NP1]|uniref:hypothetical protein n=1 Tax=Bradyrhizobium sp. NP1 TaxID=3049772 RepID=UPI0025A68EEB|nr:hypothetical protein [Bradyrhizobium sp. NP1]WJR76484.1 hypothetical protein QOU61_27525 [Bradyrhizobium sp. NP1]
MATIEKQPSLRCDARLRLLRVIGAVLLALLLSMSCAAAGDYVVTYAIDADGKIDTGKINSCRYAKPCDVSAAGLILSMSLKFARQDEAWLDLFVVGPPNCCYSADAKRTIQVKVTPGLMRVPIYQGRLRKGNEFVRNERFGVLYFEFSDLR